MEEIVYTAGKTGVMYDGYTNSDAGSKASATIQYAASSSLRRVEFGEGVTHIGDQAFYYSGYSGGINLGDPEEIGKLKTIRLG